MQIRKRSNFCQTNNNGGNRYADPVNAKQQIIDLNLLEHIKGEKAYLLFIQNVNVTNTLWCY